MCFLLLQEPLIVLSQSGDLSSLPLYSGLLDLGVDIKTQLVTYDYNTWLKAIEEKNRIISDVKSENVNLEKKLTIEEHEELEKQNKKRRSSFEDRRFGARYRTRTCDPMHVKHVLYQLS